MVAGMRAAIVVLVVAGCAEHGMTPPGGVPDAGDSETCPNGNSDKIRFEQATGCQNDGSVEFCIPDNDAALRAELTAIAPAITCMVGGGRANCLRSPGLLLCFYPTQVPEQCVAQNGAMTAGAWADMCAIAAQPAIVEIVPTFAE
jgi:hypothetical protein